MFVHLTLQTFAGMIYEDENDSSGMQEILQQLHKYVPSYGEGATQKYMRQGVVEDQLTVERGVNGLLQLENGFTPQDRLDGLHFEIADFHGGMKFSQVNAVLLKTQILFKNLKFKSIKNIILPTLEKDASVTNVRVSLSIYSANLCVSYVIYNNFTTLARCCV